MRLYKEAVQALFPQDHALVEIGAESYIAVPSSIAREACSATLL
jgi:hypothetical protein